MSSDLFVTRPSTQILLARASTLMSTPDSPKTFISYSWTDTEHEEWVLDLARDLREFGVDVIIDK